MLLLSFSFVLTCGCASGPEADAHPQRTNHPLGAQAPGTNDGTHGTDGTDGSEPTPPESTDPTFCESAADCRDGCFDGFGCDCFVTWTGKNCRTPCERDSDCPITDQTDGPAAICKCPGRKGPNCPWGGGYCEYEGDPVPPGTDYPEEGTDPPLDDDGKPGCTNHWHCVNATACPREYPCRCFADIDQGACRVPCKVDADCPITDGTGGPATVCQPEGFCAYEF